MRDETQTKDACAHQTVWWKLDPCREAGWVCADCQEVLGFRPDLDRSQTPEKVSSILHALHDGQLIYVSNGTQGDIIVQGVAERCHITGVYDQQTIVQFLLAHEELAGRHGAFWQQETRAWSEARGAGRRGDEGAEEEHG